MNSKVEEATKWLLKRRNCTLDMAFTEMREFVQTYVDAGNDMIADKKNVYLYQIEDVRVINRRFVVRGFPFNAKNPSDNVTVEFLLTDDKIEIGYPNPPEARDLPNMYVTQRWNAREEACVLYLHEEEWTVQQISQTALDPLFFA